MISVIGSSLSALVCAFELVRSGEVVRHVIAPGRPVGGHFAGHKTNDVLVDVGMVLLEPRFSEPSKSLNNFLGEDRRNSNSFNRLVFSWLGGLGFRLDDVPIYSRYREIDYEDFLIADSLELFRQLGFRDHSTLSHLRSASNDKSIHPHFKDVNRLSQLSIKEALPEIYGNTYADFILKLALKIGGPQSLNLLSRNHRTLWLPLYYPETLLQSLSTASQSLPLLSFLKPVGSGVSSIILSLTHNLNESGRYFQVFERWTNVTELADVASSTESKSSERVKIFCDESVALGIPVPKLSVNIGIGIGYSVNDLRPRVVHSLDSTSGWFRISLGLSHSKSVTVELGFVDSSESKKDLLRRANLAAKDVEVQIERISEVIVTRLRIPTAEYSGVRRQYVQTPLEKWATKKASGSSQQWYIAAYDDRNFNGEVLHGLKAASE